MASRRAHGGEALFGLPSFGLRLLQSLLVWGLLSTTAGAQDWTPAATVELLRGTVMAQLPTQAPRTLQRGSPVYSADRVATGPRSGVLLTFTDRSQITLGAQTEFTVERYRMDEAEESLLTRVHRGVFRMVTGLVARRRPEAVQMNLVVSTIGVRGTHFGGEVEGERVRIVLLEPEAEEGANAIEVWNEFGRVFVDQPGWGTEIPDARSPPSPPQRMRLQSIQNMTRSLQSIQRSIRPGLP